MLERVSHHLPLEECFFLIGLCVLVRLSLSWSSSALWGFRTHLAPRLWPRNLRRTYPGWAVITGSTDGIGKRYAEQLARRGFDIVLISRNLDKLRRVAKEIQAAFCVQVKVIEADFKNRSVLEHVKAELNGIDIDILVNNVGINTREGAMRMDEVEEDFVREIVEVNIAPLTILTRHILPSMVDKGRGIVVNITSAATYFPIPYQDIYSPTKAFVDSLTSSIKRQVEGRGIIVQSVKPYFVRTNMTACNNLAHNFPVLSVDSDKFADHALKTLEYSPPLGTAGYWVFDLLMWVFQSLPTHLMMKVLKVGAVTLRKYGHPISLGNE